MANSLTRGAWTIGVLFVGLATAFYALSEAYDGTNQEHELIETLHPLFETLTWVLPFVLLVAIAVTLVGGVAWLTNQRQGSLGR